MTLQEIRQYVVKTPYNSNPNQIESMVAQYAAEKEAADEAARVPEGALKNVEVPVYEIKQTEAHVSYVDGLAAPSASSLYRIMLLEDATPTAPSDGLDCFILSGTGDYYISLNSYLVYDSEEEYWVFSNTEPEADNGGDTPPAEEGNGNTVG